MSSKRQDARAQLSEKINRLLPGEEYKRIRQAILEAASYSGQRTEELRQTIDEANRIKTGRLAKGTVVFTGPTSADLSGFAWAIDYVIHQQDGNETIPVQAPHPTYPRPDIFVGTGDASIIYRAGEVDEDGNVQEPSYDPVTEVLLRAVMRNPDLSNEEDQGSPGTSSFVSKVATGTEVMQGNLAIAPQSGQLPNIASFDNNGVPRRSNPAIAGYYSTLQGIGGFSRILTITIDPAVQLNYYAVMEFSGISTKYEKGFLWVQFRINSAGNIVQNGLKCFGEFDVTKYTLIKTSPTTYTLFAAHDEVNSFYRFRPKSQFGASFRYVYHQLEAKVNPLPAGDRHLFSAYDPCPKELDGGSATSVYLTSQIIDGGNAQSFQP